jgi:putative glutamine amidotransferase
MTAGIEPPLVLIASDRKMIDGAAWYAVVETYMTALVHGARATPLILPVFGPEIDLDALLLRVDGVLLPGSRSNVHPARYGEAPTARAEPHDESRDAVTLPLIQAALRHGVPLFAICRGMQELNVALGGTLIAEVHETPGRNDHRAPADAPDRDARYALRQEVSVTPGGMLAGIVGPGPIRVNSLHRQAAGRLAEPLAIEAIAVDGTIEGVSVRDRAAFALGVQWHPEYWVRTDLPSQLLFTAFGDAMRERMAGRAGMRAAAE